MERLKRIDEKLMNWITTRPYGHKMEPQKHTRLLVLNAFLASWLTIDIFLNGWAFPNTVGVVIFWPSLFYEWRLWHRLRAFAEMEAREAG